jgi:hypothetical protein
MGAVFGTGPVAKPEPLFEDVLHEKEHELDAAAERGRQADEVDRHRHPVRRFFARLRRKR